MARRGKFQFDNENSALALLNDENDTDENNLTGAIANAEPIPEPILEPVEVKDVEIPKKTTQKKSGAAVPTVPTSPKVSQILPDRPFSDLETAKRDHRIALILPEQLAKKIQTVKETYNFRSVNATINFLLDRVLKDIDPEK